MAPLTLTAPRCPATRAPPALGGTPAGKPRTTRRPPRASNDDEGRPESADYWEPLQRLGDDAKALKERAARARETCELLQTRHPRSAERCFDDVEDMDEFADALDRAFGEASESKQRRDDRHNRAAKRRHDRRIGDASASAVGDIDDPDALGDDSRSFWDEVDDVLEGECGELSARHRHVLAQHHSPEDVEEADPIDEYRVDNGLTSTWSTYMASIAASAPRPSPHDLADAEERFDF